MRKSYKPQEQLSLTLQRTFLLRELPLLNVQGHRNRLQQKEIILTTLNSVKDEYTKYDPEENADQFSH
jgi:hypothetical protein